MGAIRRVLFVVNALGLVVGVTALFCGWYWLTLVSCSIGALAGFMAMEDA